MEIFNTKKNLRNLLDRQPNHYRIGFVPTMGALHEGHLSLVRCCRAENDIVVVSIFVNPTQFNDKEDLANYPRTFDRDLELLRQENTDVVFCPTVEEMYPEPDTRTFDLGGLDATMEGAFRPGHFNGVVQIVIKLFDVVRPHRAYFGEKRLSAADHYTVYRKSIAYSGTSRFLSHSQGTRWTGHELPQYAAWP